MCNDGALYYAYIIVGTLYYVRIYMGPFVTINPREDDARINKGSFPPKDGPLNHEVYCFELGSPGILSVTP